MKNKDFDKNNYQNYYDPNNQNNQEKNNGKNIIAGISIAVVASVAIAAFGFISGAFDLFTNSRELFDKLTKKETSATQATEISTIAATTTTAPPAAEIVPDIPEPETTVPVIEIVTEPPTTEIITEPETIPASVPLSSLEAFNGGWEWNNEAPVDPWGNDYSDACNYRIFQRGKEFSEYYTGGEYKRLTFNLAPHTDIGQDDEAYLQIYKDEELIYTSPVVARKTKAFSCDVDISGAEYVEIYFIDDKRSGYLFNRFIFSDAQLWTE